MYERALYMTKSFQFARSVRLSLVFRMHTDKRKVSQSCTWRVSDYWLALTDVSHKKLCRKVPMRPREYIPRLGRSDSCVSSGKTISLQYTSRWRIGYMRPVNVWNATLR